jgi:hypothetical protein
MVVGHPQPLGHHRDPHEHVADGDGGEVLAVEAGGDPGGQQQHPADLEQGEQPVGDVVGVVG